MDLALSYRVGVCLSRPLAHSVFCRPFDDYYRGFCSSFLPIKRGLMPAPSSSPGKKMKCLPLFPSLCAHPRPCMLMVPCPFPCAPHPSLPPATNHTCTYLFLANSINTAHSLFTLAFLKKCSHALVLFLFAGLDELCLRLCLFSQKHT